jgi:hypothetical protein
LDSGSVKIRATMSVALPPAPATMTLTGLVGQFSAFCAKTEFEKNPRNTVNIQKFRMMSPEKLMTKTMNSDRTQSARREI